MNTEMPTHNNIIKARNGYNSKINFPIKVENPNSKAI